MKKRLIAALAVAAVLWFYMFSPWTSGLTNFWPTMAASALILTSLALLFSPGKLPKVEKPLLQILAGILIAVFLWGVFWIGDRVSSLIFDFARPEVDSIYSMKDGLHPAVIAALLLLLIGPAEEFFWRGYVQRTMEKLLDGRKWPKDKAFLLTAGIYALVHIWSLNFMLVMAALVAGCVWGFLYRLRPQMLPALIVSHALWDALVFIWMPL